MTAEPRLGPPIRNSGLDAVERGTVLLDTGEVRIKAGRHGWVAYPAQDEFVGRSVDLYGEWSPGDAEIIAPYLQRGATVLDVGANIGTLTLFLAAAVGAQGRVLAFEPVAASFRLLVTNLCLNGLAHVEARQAAVGARSGEARVAKLDLARPGNFGAAALVEDGTGHAVEMIAIDDLHLSACDLVKADVEGREREVLAGAARTIDRCRPVLLPENEEPGLSKILIEDLLALDYRLWWHSPALFAPGNWFRHPHDVFPGLGSLNLLCLPAERDELTRPDLRPVAGSEDWPEWWPDWSRQPNRGA